MSVKLWMSACYDSGSTDQDLLKYNQVKLNLKVF